MGVSFLCYFFGAASEPIEREALGLDEEDEKEEEEAGYDQTDVLGSEHLHRERILVDVRDAEESVRVAEYLILGQLDESTAETIGGKDETQLLDYFVGERNGRIAGHQEAEQEDGDARGDAGEEREAEDDHVGGAGVVEEAREHVGHGQRRPAEEHEEHDERAEVAHVGRVGGGAEEADDADGERYDDQVVDIVPDERAEPVDGRLEAAHELQALLLRDALAHHVDHEAGRYERVGAQDGERDADVGDLLDERVVRDRIAVERDRVVVDRVDRCLGV